MAADRETSGRGSGAGGAGDLPAKIGRYTVLKPLGAGGMGVVLAAYDTDLDRKVAIKLLHRDQAASGDQTHGTTRLLREAQAMAKISHPNVLQVFEAGTHAGQVYLVLEHVEGTTLGEWQTAAPRPWREVLAMYLQAGEGLHAAHAVGIVHRDFKPENALVDAQGRVRVMDFGLARAARSERPEEPARPLDLAALTSNSLDLSLTQTGAAVGTPAYMAPEQLTGDPSDARTDEFSFCVALWEALYGERPFAGDDLRALIASVLSGEVAEPRRRREVPGWLRKALIRGLSLSPERRYPSVAALLAALRKDPAIVRRRAAVAVLSALSLGACLQLYVSSVAAGAAACEGGEAQFAEVWGPERAAGLAAAFERTGRPYAAAAAARVATLLDAQGAAWAAAHRDACEAHRRGEQSDELLDRRMGCLERRRDEIAALIEVMNGADGEVVDRAVAAAQGLGPPACGDASELQANFSPPDSAELRAAVEAVRRRTAPAIAASRAGRYKQALALIEPEAAAAEELGYRPLQADLAFATAEILDGLGRSEEAHAELLRAVWSAEAGRHDDVAARAWTAAVAVAGVKLGRFDDAARWYERASAAIARIGDPPQRRVDLLTARGAVAMQRQLAADALADFEEALRILGPDGDPLKRARLHTNSGNARTLLGRHDEAIAAQRLALDLRVRALGELHPEVAVSYNNLGVGLNRSGRLDEAFAAYERAEAIWRESLGPDHPALLNALQNMAVVKHKRHDLDAVVSLLGRAEALAGRSLPPDSPLAASLRNNLGAMHLMRGAYDEADAVLTAELARREAVHGPESGVIKELLDNLATVALARGDLARTRELLTRSLALSETPRERVVPLVGLTTVDLRTGDLPTAEAHARAAKEALAAAEPGPGRGPLRMLEAEIALRRRDLVRALAYVREAEAPELAEELGSEEHADARFVRAQVLWEARGDRRAARADAEAALAFYDRRPQADRARRAEIAAWLAKHRL